MAAGTFEERIAKDEGALTGSTLDGRYLVTRLIGEGGMGLVYEARHVVLGTRLAIKVLRPEMSEHPEALERLRREARAASAIGNEHIVEVRDVSQLEDGSTYIAMEYLDGTPLEELFDGSVLPWRRVRAICLQICDALAAAHRRGIIHRDLKPENILLVQRQGIDDFVKILDFGIAKDVNATKKLTVAGQMMGTPAYMSPEQCAGSEIDHRTDVYSFGIMMYELLTGQLPFDHENAADLCRMHFIVEAPPPSTTVPAGIFPPELDAVVLTCMGKSVDERFSSMEEVAEAIQIATSAEPMRAEKATLLGLGPTRLSGVPALPKARAARTSSLARFLVPARQTLSSLSLALPAHRPSGFMIVLVLWAVGAAGAAWWAVSHASSVTPAVPSAVASAEPSEPAEEPAEEAAAAPQTQSSEPPARAQAEPRWVSIRTLPAGADVIAEGAVVGQTPVDFPLEEETVTVRLRLAGHDERAIEVGAETDDELMIHLQETPPPRRPAARRPRPNARRRPARGATAPGTFVDPWN